MSEAQWYVVHTYSGYENKVKVDIEKTIENRGLQDQILEVSVPLEEVIELKNGAQKQVERKMFPGYVLIHMIMNDDTWYVVRNTSSSRDNKSRRKRDRKSYRSSYRSRQGFSRRRRDLRIILYIRRYIYLQRAFRTGCSS